MIGIGDLRASSGDGGNAGGRRYFHAGAISAIDVYVHQDDQRKLIAAGQQTLIRVDARPER